MLRRSLPVIVRQLSTPFCQVKPKTLYILSTVDLKTKNLLCEPLPTLTTSRTYAKTKDKKKDKKKNVTIDEQELGEYFEVEKIYKDMNKAVDLFKTELVDHASLRTSHGVIQNLKVKYDGNTYILQDLAEISMKNPKLYVLDFSMFPDAVKTVVEMFQKSELNLNVQVEGLKIFVPILNVTKEHREQLVKKSKTYFLKCKENVKDVQFNYIKKLKNIKNLSSESKFNITNQLTALGNQYVQAAEKILKEKTDELLKTD